MTPVDWPATVPDCINPTSPQGGIRDNRYSFDTDSKVAPIERPSSSWSPEVYSVELTPLSIDQFKAFQTWFAEDLAFGANPFNWNHPLTGEASVWKITKSDPPYQVRKDGRIPNGTDRRRIVVSFTIMAWPVEPAS